MVVALRFDHLHSAALPLAALSGHPLILFLGNNPGGTRALPLEPDAGATIGFPGVGGTITGDIAEYVKIAQQPTALEASDDPRLSQVAAALRTRGFAVQRIPDMDGWLAFHSVFVACVSAALYACETDPLGDQEAQSNTN